jgi:outer membrane protein
MMTFTKKLLTLTGLALSMAGAAQAQSAGTWMVRGGVTHISPHVSSSCLSAPDFGDGPGGCSRSDVSGNTQLSGGVSYMYTDHWSVDVPMALPFKHQIIGAGSLQGAGQMAEVKVLPFTVFMQYRFNEASAKFRPYIGLGLTYAYHFDETGSGKLTTVTNPGGSPTQLSVDSKWGLTPQVGATISLNDKWFIDVHYSYTNLSTTTKFSTGQHMDMSLNPSSYGVEIGYKF